MFFLVVRQKGFFHLDPFFYRCMALDPSGASDLVKFGIFPQFCSKHGPKKMYLKMFFFCLELASYFWDPP